MTENKKEKKVLFIVEWWWKKKNFDLWKKTWEIPSNLNFFASGWHLLWISWKKDWKKESLWVDLDKLESFYSPINKDTILEMKEAIKENDEIIAVFDPDNEGHTIAYHFVTYFRNELKWKDVYRATFQELTAAEIKKALERKIHFDDYDWKKHALQWLTRAFMDRVIGWTYSPMLTAKLYKEYKWFSAWRVQTPALRLIYERQKLIDEHTTSLFFNSNVNYKDFSWSHIDNWKKEEVDWMTISRNTEKDLERIIEATEWKWIEIPKKKWVKIEYEWRKEWKVKEFTEWQRNRSPYAPFSQDTLVWTLVWVLWCTVKEAKNATQLLYQNWFTTYPRWDTVQLWEEALISAHKLAMERFPEDTLKEPLQYQDKWNAKVEAWHAACTPTTVWFEKDFEEVKKWLAKSWLKDEFYFNAYEVIWKRTVASQMKNAIYDYQKLTVRIQSEDYVSKSEQCIYEWFLKIYNFNDDEENTEETSTFKLEWYKEWDKIEIENYEIVSSESKAPSMYTEKTLIQALKKYWIWRPSTYNSWMITDSLTDKEYVLWKKTKEWYVLDWWKYQLTEKWRATIEVLEEIEASIINYEYTSDMETEIDKIKEWKVSDKEVLKEFMSKIYEDVKNNWLEIDDDWFVNIIKFDPRWWHDSSNSNNKKELVYSEILDPHWNWEDQYLFIVKYQDNEYLKSEITWASYWMKLRVTEDKCPKCWSRICYDISKQWKEYWFCCSIKIKEEKDWFIPCDYFVSSSKQTDESEIETICNCNKCWEWKLYKKTTSKWDIVVCTKDCWFFNFLWNWAVISNLACDECWSHTIIKTVWSKWSRRRDCIQRTWNWETKQNEWCSWEWEWYNWD